MSADPTLRQLAQEVVDAWDGTSSSRCRFAIDALRDHLAATEAPAPRGDVLPDEYREAYDRERAEQLKADCTGEVPPHVPLVAAEVATLRQRLADVAEEFRMERAKKCATSTGASLRS